MLSAAAAALAPDAVLLRELLAVSLTGVILYAPLYDPAGSGEIVDFTFEYLNPAAQRMMTMPEVPTVTHNQQWPHSIAHGTFAFHVDAFESDEPREYHVNYQADGYDNYYRLAARRAGNGLLVSFTDTADQLRSAVEVALRESQAAEQAARAEAETQRQRFYEVLMQLPAYVAVYHGPDHVYQFVNPPYQSLFPHRSFVGRPFCESTPEADELGVVALFDRVYQTGEPYYAHEMEGWFDFQGNGQPEQVFLNLYLHPLRNPHGHIDGLLDFSYDVTEQVRARQQLQQLNQELEDRVQQRTREAEAARAEAEEQRNRLLRLFNQAPAHINLFTGPEHILTLVHSSTYELLPNRPLLGLPRRQALPELPEEQHAPFDEVYRTGKPVHALETLRRLDRFNNGELHDEYFDLTFQPMFDAAGQIEGVMSFAVNVTERVRTRQRAEVLQAEVVAVARREAQERATLYQVFEETPALIAILRGPEHRYKYFNAAYQHQFPRELAGRPVAEALPEAAEQGFVALLDRVYQTGETYFGQELPLALEQPGQEAPAAPTYYNLTYQPYRENGQTVGLSVFAYDVTEQVLARQQRAAQQQQLREVFEQAPVAICVFRGPDDELETVNPPMAEMLGRPLEELLGRPFFEAMPELVDQGLQQLLAEVRRTGVPFIAQEQEIQLARHQPGETGFFNFVYQPLRDARQQVVAITCVATEVTRQVQAREAVALSARQALALADELAVANQQLTRTNIDLDNFIYTASHDLKAPISNIEGLLSTLRGELPPLGPVGEVPYILELMQDSVDRFTKTIDHLTDVSKLQKEHDQPIVPVPLAPIIEDVRLDLAPLLHQTGARLLVDVQAVPTVLFSEKNLRSVVYNLFSNALKYRHPDRVPEVHLRARPEADFSVLEVQDNGLGLDLSRGPEDLFAMFRRLHTHVEGTGIGLYMVKRMVENAGGRIEVRSGLGQGTTFTVYFPR